MAKITKAERLKQIKDREEKHKKHADHYHNKKNEYHQKVKPLKSVLNKYKKDLLTVKGVHSVGLRVYEEKIVVYCDEVNEFTKDIPLSLDGYMVDIQFSNMHTSDIFQFLDYDWAGQQRYNDSRQRNPIRAGYSVGNVNISAGTLGSVWYSRKLDKIVGISNNHIVADVNMAKGRRTVISSIPCLVLAGGDPNFVPVLADKGFNWYETDVDTERTSTIDTITPSSFKVGDVVTITGASLGFRWGHSKVYFNGIEAPVKSWNATGTIYDNDFDQWTNVTSTIEVYVPAGLNAGENVTISIEVEGDVMIQPGAADHGRVPTDDIGQVEKFIKVDATFNGEGATITPADVGVFSFYKEAGEVDPKIFMHPYLAVTWGSEYGWQRKYTLDHVHEGRLGGWKASGAIDTNKGMVAGLNTSYYNFYRSIEDTSAMEIITKFIGKTYQEVKLTTPYTMPKNEYRWWEPANFLWPPICTVSFDMFVPYEKWKGKKVYSRVSSDWHTTILQEYSIEENQVEIVIVNKTKFAKIHAIHNYADGKSLETAGSFNIHIGSNTAINSSIFIDNIYIEDPNDKNSWLYHFTAFYPYAPNESYQIRGFLDESEIIEGMIWMKTGRTTGTIVGVVNDANKEGWCGYGNNLYAYLSPLIGTDGFYYYDAPSDEGSYISERLRMSAGGDSGSSMVTAPSDLYERFFQFYSDTYKWVARPTDLNFENVVFHPEPFKMVGNNFASDETTNEASSDCASVWLPILDLDLVPLTYEFYPMVAESYSTVNVQLEFVPMVKPKIVSKSNGNVELIQEKLITLGVNQLESYSVPIDNDSLDFTLTLPTAEILANAQSISSGNTKILVELLLKSAATSTSNAQAKMTVVLPVKSSATSISTGTVSMQVLTLTFNMRMNGQSSSSGNLSLSIPFGTIQIGLSALSASSGKVVLLPTKMMKGQASSSSTFKISVMALPIGWTPSTQYEELYFTITILQDINTEITRTLDLNLAV